MGGPGFGPLPQGLESDFPLTPFFLARVATGTDPATDKDTYLILSCCILTDTASRQYERFRTALQKLNDDSWVWAYTEAVGELYLTLLPIHRALKALRKASTRPGIGITSPQLLLGAHKVIGTMRDHLEHIEERAVGEKKRQAATERDAWMRAFGVLGGGEFRFGDDVIILDELAAWIRETRSILLSWIVERDFVVTRPSQAAKVVAAYSPDEWMRIQRRVEEIEEKLRREGRL